MHLQISPFMVAPHWWLTNHTHIFLKYLKGVARIILFLVRKIKNPLHAVLTDDWFKKLVYLDQYKEFKDTYVSFIRHQFIQGWIRPFTFFLEFLSLLMYILLNLSIKSLFESEPYWNRSPCCSYHQDFCIHTLSILWIN